MKSIVLHMNNETILIIYRQLSVNRRVSPHQGRQWLPSSSSLDEFDDRENSDVASFGSFIGFLRWRMEDGGDSRQSRR